MKRFIGDLLEHIGVKKNVLQIYFYFFNKRKTLRDRYRRKIIPLIIRRRSKDGLYGVDLDSDWLGLGARIVKTLEVLLFCDEKGMQPLIRFNYKERGREVTDYFGDLFFYKEVDNNMLSKVRYTSVEDLDELGWSSNYNSRLRLDFAKALFDKYLGVNPEILNEVDHFTREIFLNRKVLGVHYRGTDKKGEAPLISKEQLVKCINAILEERKDFELIFVSTDEVQILQYLQKLDLPVEVVCRQDAIRSNDGDQFHRKAGVSKTIINRDALVNCLLLSRCDVLLKTASILSDCSVIFNPDLEVRVMSAPHSKDLTWWPAIEINEYALGRNK